MQTPDINDLDVASLLKVVNASHEPDYLDVTPLEGAEERDCFNIVKEKVSSDGGKMILGWQLWKGKYLVEAEAHAVWEDSGGKLHDLTPKQIPVGRILFAEDENMIYEEKQIDNIRLNITKNKLVNDLIGVAKAIFKFENKGQRALKYELKLTPKEAENHMYMQQIKHAIVTVLDNGGDIDTQCPCNSGKKIKNCHVLELSKRLKALVYS